MSKKIKKEKKFNVKNVFIAIGMVLVISALTMFSREIGGYLGKLFAKNNNEINKEEVDNKKYDLKIIETQEEYTTINDSNNYSIMLLINDNCSLCEDQAQILNEIMNEYKLIGYSLNIDKAITKTTKWFLENTILPEDIDELPITMFYKNGEFVFAIEGYRDKSMIEGFLKSIPINK